MFCVTIVENQFKFCVVYNDEKWTVVALTERTNWALSKELQNDIRMSKIQLLFPNVGTAALFDVSVTLSG